MVALGGVGRGGANMEETGYLFLEVIAYPVPFPQLFLSASCPQQDKQPPPAHFPSATVDSKSTVPWTTWIKPSETTSHNKCFSFRVIFAILSHSEKSNWHSYLHTSEERGPLSLAILYVQVGTPKHTSPACRRHGTLPCFWCQGASPRADWSH